MDIIVAEDNDERSDKNNLDNKSLQGRKLN